LAKYDLLNSSKFFNLCSILRMESEAHVVGHLEVMWNSAHRKKTPILGDFDRIEGAAKWPFTRERHQFAAALVKTGFVDEVVPGLYAVHDYYDHAPEYRKKLISSAAKSDPTVCRETFYMGIDALQKVIDEHEARRKNEGHSTASAPKAVATVQSTPVLPEISGESASTATTFPEISALSCLVRSSLVSSSPPSSPPAPSGRRKSPEVSGPSPETLPPSPDEAELRPVIGRVTDAVVHLIAVGDEESADLLEDQALTCRSVGDWTALAQIATEALQRSTRQAVPA